MGSEASWTSRAKPDWEVRHPGMILDLSTTLTPQTSRMYLLSAAKALALYLRLLSVNLVTRMSISF